MKEIQAEVSVNKNILTFPQIHSKIEILFCLEGEIEITIGKYKKTLQQNGCALVMPYTLHSYQSLKKSKSLVITAKKEIFTLYHRHFSAENFYPFIDNAIDLDIDHIIRKLTSNERYIVFEQLVGYIYVILSFIFKKTDFDFNKVKLSSDFLPNILNYIEENFHKDISLESISAANGLKSTYLSRAFLDQMGFTVTKYINEVRVSHAKSLLLSTNNSITDIAFESGFNSIRTFNRVFLEHTHYTPKEYRARKNRTSRYEQLTTKDFEDEVTLSDIPTNGTLTFYK